MHRRAGLRDPTHHNPTLHLVKVASSAPMYGAPDPASRRPITTSDLLAVLARSHSLHGQDRHMLAAAFTFAFFGLLRISEFTTPSLSHFDPRLHPTLADLSWAPTHCIFHLRHSKTDQFFQGHMMHIPRVGGPLCPFTAMARYLADRAPIRIPTRIPLFSFASGRLLTRTSCLAHLRLLLHKAQYPPKAFNTHSFCIGQPRPQLKRERPPLPSSAWAGGVAARIAGISAPTTRHYSVQLHAWPGFTLVAWLYQPPLRLGLNLCTHTQAPLPFHIHPAFPPHMHTNSSMSFPHLVTSTSHCFTYLYRPVFCFSFSPVPPGWGFSRVSCRAAMSQNSITGPRPYSSCSVDVQRCCLPTTVVHITSTAAPR